MSRTHITHRTLLKTFHTLLYATLKHNRHTHSPPCAVSRLRATRLYLEQVRQPMAMPRAPSRERPGDTSAFGRAAAQVVPLPVEHRQQRPPRRAQLPPLERRRAGGRAAAEVRGAVSTSIATSRPPCPTTASRL